MAVNREASTPLHSVRALMTPPAYLMELQVAEGDPPMTGTNHSSALLATLTRVMHQYHASKVLAPACNPHQAQVMVVWAPCRRCGLGPRGEVCGRERLLPALQGPLRGAAAQQALVPAVDLVPAHQDVRLPI